MAKRIAPAVISGWFDPHTNEFHPVPAGGTHKRMTVLSAVHVANTESFYPTFDVYADGADFMGNFVGGLGATRDAAIEALAEAATYLT